MDAETVRAKMMAQVDQARQSAMAEVYGWAFDLADLTVYVTIRHRRRRDPMYLMRVVFDDFPRRAPSYIFVDRATRQVTQEAWPPGIRHDGPPPGICTPGTREFHEHLHKEHPWDPEKYTFLSTLQMIAHMMERAIGG